MTAPADDRLGFAPDEDTPPGVEWERLVAHAAENTELFPGDLIVR